MTCFAARIRQCFGFSVLCFFCLLSNAPAQTTPWQHEKIQNEPIFNGHFLLREAGRENADILLLVHGLGPEAAAIWEPFVPKLASRFHVIAPDLPGFGRSARANQLYSPTNYAQFIYWLLDRFPDKPVYLVGHSLGGAISLNVAAHYGERLESLILIDSVGLLHRLAVSQHFVRDLIRFDLPFFSDALESQLGRIAGLVLEKTSRVPLDPDLVLATAAAREKVLGGDPGQIAALALVQTDFTRLLSMVTIPTWLIWGEHDQIAPLRIATILDWNLTNSELKLLAGLGHVPMNEDSRRFSDMLWHALQNKPASDNKTGLTTVTSAADATCDNENGRVFRGEYASLKIHQCKDVVITDARILHIHSVDSRVTIKRSIIGDHAEEQAIHSVRSQMEMTGVDIYGNVGLLVDQSRLDLAGVRFIDTPVAVSGQGNSSSLLFSSSRKIIDGESTSLHLSRSLNQGEHL
ncbi:MAG: alpha/beta hydrolase [Pelovirga sp.]